MKNGSPETYDERIEFMATISDRAGLGNLAWALRDLKGEVVRMAASVRRPERLVCPIPRPEPKPSNEFERAKKRWSAAKLRRSSTKAADSGKADK